MNMIEYLPWSAEELKKTVQAYNNKKLTILDIELGGTCNFHCVYCDSPDRSKPFRINREKLRIILETGNIRWVYICGLGEPTYGANHSVLINLLKISEENGVRVSIFTNLSTLDDELLGYVKRGTLFLLFKMDSFNSKSTDYLYGTDTSIHSQRIKELIDCVRLQNNCTNIAASIVPTVKNIKEIPSIVGWCLDHNVYPLIAELEHAGKGFGLYEQLSPSKDELARLKILLLTEYGIDIKVPICPSIIGGIHINNEGVITVDQKTGFSCHWFWLENPCIKKITDFNHEGSFQEYEKEIIDYRNDQKEDVCKCLENGIKEPFVFGGCGGSLDEILMYHLGLHTCKD